MFIITHYRIYNPTNTVREGPNIQRPSRVQFAGLAGPQEFYSTHPFRSRKINCQLTSILVALVQIPDSGNPRKSSTSSPSYSQFLFFLHRSLPTRSMIEPRQPSSTPPAVNDNEGEMEAQSSSPALPSHVVIARDEEDGLAFVKRLTALGGPAGGGEGLLWSASLFPGTDISFQYPTGTVPPFSSQPLTPDSPNPMPLFLSASRPAHISFLIASQFALYYRGQAPLTNAPALEAIALEGTAQTS